MVTRWLADHLLPALSTHLEAAVGRHLSLFFDKAELALGEEWVVAQRRALQQSRIMLGIWSPSYFRSRWCVAEFETFRRRSELNSESLFAPVVIHNGDLFPPTARQYQMFDMQRYMIPGEAFRNSQSYIGFEERVRELSRQLEAMLRKVPPFRSDWPIIEPKSMEIPEAKLPRFSS